MIINDAPISSFFLLFLLSFEPNIPQRQESTKFIHFNSSQFDTENFRGKQIFRKNCMVCHIGGNNLIIPEKNLKKETLEANGMNNINAISYQILNGKNGMPAFGGRLDEKEIEAVANYVLEKSNKNFEED
jgi:cytochrome c6